MNQHFCTRLTGFETILNEDASELLMSKELVESLVNVSEDVIFGEVVLAEVELIVVEIDETVLAGLVEISDEDCSEELTASDVPIDTVLREVSAELVD